MNWKWNDLSKRMGPVILIFLALLLLPFTARGESKIIKMSTTTSTENSGLLNVLLPEFTKETGIKVKIFAKGTGAAIRDVIIALHRRFPAAGVIIYPTSVQGGAAAAQIVRALDRADARAECDVLILTRGGGSLEDLWPFNEEIVARAIAALRLPVIVGVGHETDFTIADFVADVRAPTPSQAAELAVPVQADIERRLTALGASLARVARHALSGQRQRLEHAAHRLSRVHPRVSIQMRQRRLDELEERMARAIRHRRTGAAERLLGLEARLGRAHPARRIQVLADSVRVTRRELNAAMLQRLERIAVRISLTERGLRALSPLATLDRGYAIVTSAGNGRVVTKPAEVTVGSDLDIRIAGGRLGATVTKTPE